MVFYRKYRNQTIGELDNAKVRESLTASLSNLDNTPHAFLFTGPKGLGKTSSARIVAKVVNCVGRVIGKEQSATLDKQKNTFSAKQIALRESIEPCNTCEQCISITNGTNLDVMEIDAASNRGIDEIRDLKEKIKLSPVSAHKKVYIIDEVHMLTTEAFNALLKTLEEPPAHAMFILCTTETHKIPATIFSRCFTVSFTKATTEELVRSFKRIIIGEKLEADDDALFEIAKMSDGGFRDGAKLLEEIVSLSGNKKITKELVEENYHNESSGKLLLELIHACEVKDISAGLSVIQTIVTHGIDMRFFMLKLLESLHDMLLSTLTAKQETSSPLATSDIKALLSGVSKAYTDMKYAVLPQLPLELFIVEWCTAEVITPTQHVETTIQKTVIEQGKVTEEKTVMTQDGVTVSSLRKQVGDIAKIKALYGETKEVEEVKETVKTTDLKLEHIPNDGVITKEWLDTFWKCIITEMKTHNHTVAGVLRGCVIKSFDRKTLIIETAFKFHKEKLDHSGTMESLEKICHELTGSQIAVSVVLKS